MLRYAYRGRGRFRVREELKSKGALLSDGNVSIYSADTTTMKQLAYFALSVFWRGAVYRWPIGRDFSQLLRFGPFEEQIRQYLLGNRSVPERVALTVCVSNHPDPPLGPMTYIDGDGQRFHRFHLPGMMFTLHLGNGAERMYPVSVLSAPEHPIWMGAMSDETFVSEVLAFIRRNRGC